MLLLFVNVKQISLKNINSFYVGNMYNGHYTKRVFFVKYEISPYLLNKSLRRTSLCAVS